MQRTFVPAWLLLLLGTVALPGAAAGQASRGVEPVVLTGSTLQSWSNQGGGRADRRSKRRRRQRWWGVGTPAFFTPPAATVRRLSGLAEAMQALPARRPDPAPRSVRL